MQGDTELPDLLAKLRLAETSVLAGELDRSPGALADVAWWLSTGHAETAYTNRKKAREIATVMECRRLNFRAF